MNALLVMCVKLSIDRQLVFNIQLTVKVISGRHQIVEYGCDAVVCG